MILIPDHTPLIRRAGASGTSAHRMEMTRIMADRLDRRVLWKRLIWRCTGAGRATPQIRSSACGSSTLSDELWLMVGTDMFLTLQSWHEPEEIMSRAGILTFGRNRDDKREMFERQAQFLAKTYQAAVHIMTLPGL